MLRNLEMIGFNTRVDRGRVASISEYLTDLAAREGFPLGKPMEYDAFHYQHQMPGGMLANWRYQLRQSGIEDRFDEILQEIARIRPELGWPIMVTPFSQIIAVQAMLNVIGGERYRNVPDEVKMYALGHFGKLLAPVDSDILDRIVENGSPKIPLQPPSLAPAVAELRRAYPNVDDDERLLRYMFPGKEVENMRAAGPLKVSVPFGSPVARLVQALAERPAVKYLEVERKAARFVYSKVA
jgi:oxaloacetate decarboxylase alpha subunit